MTSFCGTPTIMTLSGVEVNFSKPDPDSININDISNALSRIPRFCGHTRFFYSVAQHCLMCSYVCKEFPLEALMHDATEAYMMDLPKPLKRLIPYYGAIEDRLAGAIALKLNFKYPFPEEIHIVDKKCLATEGKMLCHKNWNWKSFGVDLYSEDIVNKFIVYKNQNDVALDFLTRYTELTGEPYGLYRKNI